MMSIKIIETNLKFKSLTARHKTSLIVLHHSWNVFDIHRFHKKELKWSGIGYHYFVDKQGNIYRGRPVNCVGAHTKGFNSFSIGICAQGDFMQNTMPKAQTKAIINLCSYLSGKYNIKTVKGHRDLTSTNCPGTYYPLDKIKSSALKPIKSINSNYKVISGDTLWKISHKFNTTVEHLKSKNNLTSNTIYPNQILKI